MSLHFSSMRLLLSCLTFILLTTSGFAQFDHYQFYREVEGIQTGGWYRIPLPENLLYTLREDMNDLRLLELGADTTDTPFIIHSEGYSKNWSGVAVKELNERDGKFTFRFDGDQQPNRMKVEVDQRNYDLTFDIEGSNNRLIWDPVASDLHIVGMVERDLSYAHNEVVFPASEHKFYRLTWDSSDIAITGVALGKSDQKEGTYQLASQTGFRTETDTDKKQTVLYLDLENRVPVSKIELTYVADDAEFARTVDIRYAKQTITENDGSQRYIWRDWDRKVMSSYEENIFHLDEVWTDHIELTIYDQDELPLAIREVQVFGLAYEIRAMLAGDKPYQVIYGSEQSRAPSASRTRPPSTINTATLGREILILKDEEEDRNVPQLFSGESESIFSPKNIGLALGLILIAFFGIKRTQSFLRKRKKR